MKFQIRIFLFILFFSNVILAQTAFSNLGNIQIHEGAAIGFHTSLINNGVFNQNLGLTGFYNLEEQLSVSGANKTVFNNVEVAVENDLMLQTSMAVQNNLSFISGKIVTPKEDLEVSLEFLNYNVYSGEGDQENVHGYVTSVNTGEFIFPLGDENSFRPMIIPNQLANTSYKGAYYKENPNNPEVFSQTFDTSIKQPLLEKINDTEFWDLDGTTETDVVLTWDFDSDIGELTNDIENLRVVGWEKSTEKWVDLGQVSITGTIENGTIQSTMFRPDEYEVLTIGADFREVLGILEHVHHNFGFSPNGDGVHDNFVIDGLELRPNNTIEIYNRWGVLVYSKHNYNNTWNGISNHNLTLNKNEVLPVGTYFYILTFHDENSVWRGYVYLNK